MDVFQSYLSYFFQQGLTLSAKFAAYLQQRVKHAYLTFLPSKYKALPYFLQQNPELILLFGCTLMNLLAKIPKVNEEDGQNWEEKDEESTMKWEKSTGIKSDESLLMKGEIEVIREVLEEEETDDRLFFQVFNNYKGF